jgi:hypothetical protein
MICPARANQGKVKVMAIERIFPLLLAAAALLPLRAGDDINWLGSYREGLQVARETGKPLLVEFRCEA